MNALTLTFYLDDELVDVAMAALDRDVLPAYRNSPHFLGLIVLRGEQNERQTIGISIWDGDQPDCEDVMGRFRDELRSISGTQPPTANYHVLRMVAARDV